MDKTEIIIGDMKIVRIDSLNWQVFERREIKDNHKTKRGGQIDWIPCPAFFGGLLPALNYAKERNRNNKLVSGELKDAIAQIEQLDRDFLREAQKAVMTR